MTNFIVYNFSVVVTLFSAFLLLLIGIFKDNFDRPQYASFGIALGSALATLIMLLFKKPIYSVSYLNGAILIDDWSFIGHIVISSGLLVTILISYCTNVGRILLKPEFTSLLLFSSAGLMMICSSGEFISLVLSIELASIPLYVLIGFTNKSDKSLEASIKYFILGTAATSVIILGMALLYMHTGSLFIDSLQVIRLGSDYPFATLGMFLFIIGIIFKIGAFPLHFWVPDVYEASPSLLSGFMAGLVKASVAIAFVRVLTKGFAQEGGIIVFILSIIALASVVLGSIYGLVQFNIKRLLGYSSIVNAGYFVLGFAVLAVDPSNSYALSAIASFVVVYALMIIGAFAILDLLEQGCASNTNISSMQGLSQNNRFLAICMTFFLLGLAGIPPLAGFYAKFLLISSAVSRGLIGLSLILAFFSLISLYYYLKIIKTMWFEESNEESLASLYIDGSVTTLYKFILGSLVVICVIIGLVGPRWALG